MKTPAAFTNLLTGAWPAGYFRVDMLSTRTERVCEGCSESLITAAKHIFPPTLEPSAPSAANEVSRVSRPCARQGLVSRGTKSFKQKMQKSSGQRSPRSHLINRRCAGGRAVRGARRRSGRRGNAVVSHQPH